MRSARARVAIALTAAATLAGCSKKYEGGGELRAERVVLQRQVDGLRESVERMERGEPVFPEKDVAVAIDESLLRELILAELPFEAESGPNRLTLAECEVRFHGAPTVRLRGSLARSGAVDLQAAVEVIGAIADIEVDAQSAALKARIAVDHLDIEQAAGIESLVSGATLDELARALRLAIADKLPVIRIPVKVEQAIELPAVTSGPVRVAGARMPIDAGVDGVFAGEGRLWIGIHFQPGELVKTADAPDVSDLTAEEVGASLAEKPR
jgi:hypothetical protein